MAPLTISGTTAILPSETGRAVWGQIQRHALTFPAMIENTSNPPAPLLTVRQVAERLSLSSTAVYALCDSGELPAFKIGAGKRKRYRIEPVSVEAYLERSKVRPVVEVARPARAGRVAPGGFVMLRAAGFRG